jgi:hypothetical protein
VNYHRIGLRIPWGVEVFLFTTVGDRFRCHPGCYLTGGTKGSFAWWESNRTTILNTRMHLARKLKLCVSVPLLPHMPSSRYLIYNRDKSTFTFTKYSILLLEVITLQRAYLATQFATLPHTVQMNLSFFQCRLRLDGFTLNMIQKKCQWFFCKKIKILLTNPLHLILKIGIWI